MKKMISTTAAIALLAAAPSFAQISADADVNADAAADLSTEATDLAGESNSNIGGTAGADLGTDTDIATDADTDLNTGTDIATDTDTGISTGTDSTLIDGQADTDLAQTGELGADATAEGFAEADIGAINGNDLIGADVIGAEAEKVAEVETVLTDSDGKIASLVVNVGGFLGIGEKPVEVPVADLRIEQDAEAKFRVSTNYTEDELEAMQEFEGES